MKTSGTCKRDPGVLCGVVNNQDNCTLHNLEECRDNPDHSVTYLLHWDGPKIILELVRFNWKTLKLSVMEKQMCPKCRIIYRDVPDLKNCIICDQE